MTRSVPPTKPDPLDDGITAAEHHRRQFRLEILRAAALPTNVGIENGTIVPIPVTESQAREPAAPPPDPMIAALREALRREIVPLEAALRKALDERRQQDHLR